jgi:hypothetical protein
LVGAGAQAVSAWLQSDAERKRAHEQQDLIREINAQQLAWQKELRGEGGAPVTFPRYARDVEQSVFQDALKAYEATGRLPGQAARAYENIRGQTGGLLSGVVDAIRTGATREARLTEQEPVAEARLSAARTPTAAWARTIQERVNKARARGRQGGFAETGGLLQREFADIEQSVRDEEGAAMAAAILQNAIERAKLQEFSRAEQIATGMNAGQIAEALAAIEQLPARGVSNELLARLRAFSPFFVKQSFDPLRTEYDQPLGYTPTSAAVLSSLSGSAGSLVPVLAQLFQGQPAPASPIGTGAEFDYGGELTV